MRSLTSIGRIAYMQWNKAESMTHDFLKILVQCLISHCAHRAQTQAKINILIQSQTVLWQLTFGEILGKALEVIVNAESVHFYNSKQMAVQKEGVKRNFYDRKWGKWSLNILSHKQRGNC